MGMEGLKNRYLKSLEVALYCKEELIKIGIEAWSNEGSITVVLPKMSDEIKDKWQLATEDITHIICMPNVTKMQIDAFIDDVKREKEVAASADFVLESLTAF
jgi:histidine decarboxylase